MTEGSPTRHILSFTVPLIFGNLFQQLYSMVDTMIVGRFLGKEALAAVGSTGSLTFLILGFCLGLCSGFAIPVAQSFGAKNYENLRRYVGNILWLTIGSAAVMTLLTVCLCRPMLQAMNTPGDIIDKAYAYLVVIFAGIPATILYNALSCLLRALGDSRTPVFFLLIASLTNVGLDFLLVVVIPMGVTGAAVATIASQLLAGVTCFVYVLKKFPLLHIKRDDAKPRWEYMKHLCGMGVPMGLQSSITAIGSILLQTAVNSLGSLMVAAVTAATKVHMLFCCFYDSLGIAMSTYSGQNIGGRQIKRLGPGLRSGMLIGVVFAIFALVVGAGFGHPLLLLFVESTETQLLDSAYLFLVVNLSFYPFLAAVNVFRLFIQGMGFSKIAIFAGVFEMVARSFNGLVLVPAFGFTAACFASPIAWVLADLFLVPVYFSVRKRVELTIPQEAGSSR